MVRCMMQCSRPGNRNTAIQQQLSHSRRMSPGSKGQKRASVAAASVARIYSQDLRRRVGAKLEENGNDFGLTQPDRMIKRVFAVTIASTVAACPRSIAMSMA